MGAPADLAANIWPDAVIRAAHLSLWAYPMQAILTSTSLKGLYRLFGQTVGDTKWHRACPVEK